MGGEVSAENLDGALSPGAIYLPCQAAFLGVNEQLLP